MTHSAISPTTISQRHMNVSLMGLVFEKLSFQVATHTFPAPSVTSSVQTHPKSRRPGDVSGIARAMRIRPIRGVLLRASKAYHFPPKNTSNHALKSIGE